MRQYRSSSKTPPLDVQMRWQIGPPALQLVMKNHGCVEYVGRCATRALLGVEFSQYLVHDLAQLAELHHGRQTVGWTPELMGGGCEGDGLERFELIVVVME